MTKEQTIKLLSARRTEALKAYDLLVISDGVSPACWEEMGDRLQTAGDALRPYVPWSMLVGTFDRVVDCRQRAAWARRWREEAKHAWSQRQTIPRIIVEVP